jgi:signal transduction histidine kinase
MLAEQRNEILRRWLQASAAQSFHEGRRITAVAAHIPQLLDALIALMTRSAPRWLASGPPLDDPDVLAAAQAHAQSRFEQGLAAVDIVTEFRLLRQEIGRTLRLHLPSGVSAQDAVGAEILMHDALDGAISLALDGLTRQIEELREEFLATIVHDLRQPITTIKGHHQLALQQLTRADPDVSRATDLLRHAEAATNRLGRLVDELTDASRVALGRLQLRIEQRNLLEMLRDAVERLDPFTASRVGFEPWPDDLDTHVEVDPGLMDRVLSNLLSNAIKFSPTGSPIHIELSADGDALRLAIRDHGIGLAPDEVNGLFNRYSRAQGAVEHGIEGIGLGLYLSRGIIEAHGGRIWAESAGRGRGATVHVLLPRSYVEAPAPAPRSARVRPV